MRTVLGEITNTVSDRGTVDSINKVREGEHVQSRPSEDEADLLVIEECSAKILDIWNEFVSDLPGDETSFSSFSWLRELYELSGLPPNQRNSAPSFELDLGRCKSSKSSESDEDFWLTQNSQCQISTIQRVSESATSDDEASLVPETKLQRKVQSHTEPAREDGNAGVSLKASEKCNVFPAQCWDTDSRLRWKQ
eukprot:Skav215779  [mRNA]  locus=scaffold2278:165140:166725:+ [translate_table: standard]